MAHMENYTKKDLKKVLREHERSLQEYTNKVDLSRSDQNYGYGTLSASEAMQAVNRRVTTVMNGKEVQTQTNICSEWVISCPLELVGGGNEKSFFDECWKFAGDRYGQENMIAGFVHMDETRPHMHMMLVPETTSRKTGNRTVSSASLMTKAELSGFHTDLDKHCESVFGQKGLVKNGKTIASGVSIQALAQIQENVRQKLHSDEIDSYRGFLKKHYLLDEYDRERSASTAPVEIPTEAPQKPVEAPKPVLSHNPKVNGKIQPEKPQEPSEEKSYMDRKKEMLSGNQPSTEKRPDMWYDHMEEMTEDELFRHAKSPTAVGLVSQELVRREKAQKALADKRASEANALVSVTAGTNPDFSCNR